MEIEERITENVVILDLKGKLTIGEGDELLKEKIASLMEQGHRNFLLNLESVPYFDSAGLGAVVHLYTKVSQQGGSLKLLHLAQRIRDHLTRTKLITVFESFRSEAEAVASFEQETAHA